MRYVISFISLLTTYFLVAGVTAWIRSPKENDSNSVVLSKIVLIGGILSSIVFLVPTVILVISANQALLFFAVFFAFFSLMGDVMIVAYINCRIVFGKDDFTYKTFWGVKHTVQYKDLTAIRGKNKDIKLFAGKRVIRVDEGAINGKRFVLYARQQYKRHHNGMAIPQIAKKDLFNNHVENPGEFIFIYAILTVAFLGMTVLIVCLTIPENETEFVPKTVVTDTYEVSEETLVISDLTGTTYHIWDYEALLVESAGFFEKLDSKTELRLLVKYNEKADEPYYIVSGIEAEEKQYLSFDAWYKNEWKDTVPVFAMVFFLDLLMLAFTWLSIYVGRNPHKFSDRVLHMFYKPGYIHRD